MRYNEATDQREDDKEKEAWKVAIVAVAAFLVIGVTIWFTGFGGKY
jgi:hypothetical protein